ncbi:hypothetical protein SAMN05444279_11812 [Ruegeria intermedia]|uniref:EamA-like transporter family protein n=1 Tax=Ruegeria intermedia TaxID=996115 RepID=A0A1M4Z4D2_9RHOB|nr:hypothetical protein [Ruegeria intermedia]SHF12914.1 hypothetical protein SAMN05444279_11812 [Ruegeria intermedia]
MESLTPRRSGVPLDHALPQPAPPGPLLLGSFIVAICRIGLSTANPAVMGLEVIGLLVVGCVLFSETLSLQKIAGIGLVMAGVLSQVDRV